MSDEETVEMHHVITWGTTAMMLDNEEFEYVRKQAHAFEPLLCGDWSEISVAARAGTRDALVGAIEQLCPEIGAGLLDDDIRLRHVWCTYIIALVDNNCLPEGGPLCTIVSE